MATELGRASGVRGRPAASRRGAAAPDPHAARPAVAAGAAASKWTSPARSDAELPGAGARSCATSARLRLPSQTPVIGGSTAGSSPPQGRARAVRVDPADQRASRARTPAHREDDGDAFEGAECRRRPRSAASWSRRAGLRCLLRISVIAAPRAPTPAGVGPSGAARFAAAPPNAVPRHTRDTHTHTPQAHTHAHTHTRQHDRVCTRGAHTPHTRTQVRHHTHTHTS